MEKNTSSSTQHRVLFNGTAGEYFPIWLVNSLLTLITLGIYSPWALVRERRYFYGNTEIAGDRFDYHARPIDILKGRIIVFLGLILFFILSAISHIVSMIFMLGFFALAPWIIIRSWRYNALMTSFRGIRFNYHCDVGRAYWALCFAPLLMIIGIYVFAILIVLGIAGSASASASMGIVFAVIGLILMCVAMAVIEGIIATLTHGLYINNMSLGQLPFKAELSKKSFIKIMLKGILITLCFLALALLSVSSLISSLISYFEMGGRDPDMVELIMAGSVGSVYIAFIIMMIGGLIASVYITTAQRNYTYGQTQLGKNLRLKSTLSVGGFIGLMLTNTLIVIFTLGLGAPIAEIRRARYLANATLLEGDISLQDVTAHHDTAHSAVAEEVVAAFDLNPGL